MSLDAEFSRLIDATPEEAFDAFTDAEGQEAFYGQDPSRLPGDRPPPTARSRVDRDAAGRIELSHDAREFTFEVRHGKTLMTMVQRGFPTAELRDEHARGLPNAFARLERIVGRQRPLD